MDTPSRSIGAQLDPVQARLAFSQEAMIHNRDIFCSSLTLWTIAVAHDITRRRESNSRKPAAGLPNNVGNFGVSRAGNHNPLVLGFAKVENAGANRREMDPTMRRSCK
jgi:hypothetical protein